MHLATPAKGENAPASSWGCAMDLIAMRVVSRVHVEAFERDGFVVILDMLSDRELNEFGSAVDAAVAARTRHDHRRLQEKTRYEQSFQQCINLWEDHLEVRPLTFHPRIGEAAARLLGVPAVRLWHDQ